MHFHLFYHGILSTAKHYLQLAGWLLISSCNVAADAPTAALTPAIAAQNNTITLPAGSRLLNLSQKRFHIHSSGLQHKGPAIILISGPNQHFHADSAWFALLQPMLAQYYRVYAIDRLGSGWSDDSPDMSYRRFAADLPGILQALKEKEVYLVSFASGSISASLWAATNTEIIIRGLLLIDPDIPLPATVAIYQGYPTSWYLEHIDELLPELATGIWNEKTAKKLAMERKLVQQLVSPANQALMNWLYFDAMLQQRQSIQRQQSRALEFAHYSADLAALAALEQQGLPPTMPISIIDTDFEAAEIAADPAQAAPLRILQQQGKLWAEQQTSRSGGQYLFVPESDHLIMFQRPELVLQLIQQQLVMPQLQ